ncbi:protein RCC2-like [Tropilaelaps mercedesae]|uniref:Protein RCC2-like n=1 Tax=Tropilaelaps mercedesae TaxID=418985 RepID=A0A1V9Y380_9ACAR|nr:protein RCC2-like [Tropilaelaps mercedesae]
MSAAKKQKLKNGSRVTKKKREEEDDDDFDDFDDQPRQASPASSTGGDADQADLEEGAIAPTEDELAKHLGASGRIVLAGCVSWDSTGKSSKNKNSLPFNCLWSPMRFGPVADKKICQVVTGRQGCHTVLITNEGKTWVFGRNASGQLGICDTKARNIPVMVDALKESTVVAAAAGKNHTLFLTINGTVFGCGENKCGQVGVGNNTGNILVPTRLNMRGRRVVKMDCGNEFSMLVDDAGSLFACGSPEYGQLGNNTDGQYFVTSSKLAFNYVTTPKRIPLFVEKEKDGRPSPIHDVKVVDVSCGMNHTAVVDLNRRVFTWGFGGYGRLGHSSQSDEKVPRLLRGFEGPQKGVARIWCGGSCTFVLNNLNILYMAGKIYTGGSREANMYPQVVQDLSGWNIVNMGVSDHGVCIAADNNLVVQGGGKTYGELALGEGRKTSANYDTVKSLEGIKIKQIALGLGHLALLVLDENEEVTAKINKLGQWTPKCA